MNSETQKIPETLVFEMVQGKPVYYKGYTEYLSGSKKLEQLTGISKIQAFFNY